MADPTEAKDAETEEPLIESEDLSAIEGAGKAKQFFVLCAGVAVLAAGAGYAAAVFGGCGGPDQAEAGEETVVLEPGPAAEVMATYKDFEPITVNLDEPRLARYLRLTVTVAVPAEKYETVSKTIDENMPVLRDWLTVYFASCSLEDVRGEINLNRIRREILDALNQQLWPEQKPRITKVLFKEFTVS